MVSIKDIAKEANVGCTAVSIVLGNRNSPGRVSEELRTRIKDIAVRMGYCRNAASSNMRSGKTNVLAFISNGISQEYTSRVLEGALISAEQNNFFLKLIIPKDDEVFKISIERLMEQRPSGLIVRGLAKSQSEFLSDRATTLGIPIAYIENYYENSGIINVFSNDTIGMQTMVSHLYSLGHKRIAYISSGLNLGFAARRYQGYCQGMKMCGLEVDDTLRFEAAYGKAPELFYMFIKKIVSGRHCATAICADSDVRAQTAMNMVQSLNKKIPEDISIAGYAYLQLCNDSFPTLTTVKQPFEKMGMAAADNLIKAIQIRQFESTIQIPTELVIQKSSGSAKVFCARKKE